MTNQQRTDSVGRGALMGAGIGGFLVGIPLLGLAGTPKISVGEGVVVAIMYGLPGTAIGALGGALLGFFVTFLKKQPHP